MVRMLAFLLLVSALLGQGGPALSNQNGTITGALRNPAGAPATGIRVSALARPEELKDLALATALAGLGETDAAGRYRLENIPPGRYYIVAGRVDIPTFYPGTIVANEGTVVSVAPGLTVSGIDFVLNNVSAGRAISNGQGSSGWVVSIQTRIEGGGRVPLFAGGRFPVLRFSRPNSAGIDETLSVPNVSLSSPEYHVTVEDLPEGYSLKSLTFGSVDLKSKPLKLPTSGSLTNPVVPVTQDISVVLTVAPAPQAAGVRITGSLLGNTKRSIYISGKPGAIYSDGSFEFTGVPPGVHTIVTLDSPVGQRSLGASLVVGGGNVGGVELEELAAAPLESDRAKAPTAAGNRVPGTRIPPAALRGRIVDGDTREAMNAGKVMINGDYSATFSLDENGGFEVLRLLPGKYLVEAVAFGVGTVSREVVLGEQDATVALEIVP